MMCDKDIIQLFFEDLNYVMSTLKISYHYISTVTVSCSNKHPVCAGCLLSRHFFLDILTFENGAKWLSQNFEIKLPLYTE
jgi:hypothetical protein